MISLAELISEQALFEAGLTLASAKPEREAQSNATQNTSLDGCMATPDKAYGMLNWH